MFVLKSLLGKMWGNTANPELIQIPAGQLYLVRPDSIKGSRECIFKDAVATIRRTGVEFQYQLVVTRAYEEGEEQLLDDDAETDDERVFLIDESLCFQFGSLEGNSTIGWKDLSGDEEDVWEFISSDSVPRPTNEFFELTLWNCVYERKYNRSHENATPEELASLRGSTSTVESSDPFKDVPTLSKTPAELYLFDTETDMFVIQEKNAQVDIALNGPFDTWVIVRQDSTPFISLPIDNEMGARFDMANRAFMFTFRESEDLPGMTWCLRFGPEVFLEWKEKFTIYLWEGKNQTAWDKKNESYIQSAYDNDIEMAEPEDDVKAEEEEEEQQVDGEGSEDEDETASEASDDSEAGPSQAFSKGSRNNHLAIGFKDDVSFVTRGDMIGVFAHQNDRIKFRTTIDRVKDLEGNSFAPDKVMLHNQDADMLLLNPSQEHSIMRMDLERGQVVDEWKISDDIKVINIIPESKFAQMNPQQTLVGHSHNGIFRIDPRVAGNKLVESQFKQYATKNDFSAAATTESGKLAVASNKGDIRLFDTIGKNAKTALPALGDPIIGVDVSSDGRWLIATCKTYLLLVDLLIGDGRYKGSLGFDRSFPADSKPIPRRLQLRPEHVAYMKSPISFTPARFNAGVNETEKTIVTSTGNFVITWNLRRLRQGRVDDYQIKQYDSRVVADNFKYGADKNIVVALEHDVKMANKKDLMKPTRSSLLPSSGSSKIRVKDKNRRDS